MDMGTSGLGDMVPKKNIFIYIYICLGLDIHGDMGSRGHGTENIHTFRVRHGDMGFRGHGVYGAWYRRHTHRTQIKHDTHEGV